MNGKEDRYYWKKSENELLSKLLGEDLNDIDYTRIYKKLYPKLRKMAEGIASKYYGMKEPNPDLIEDSITRVLIEGKDRYSPDKKNKLYSFATSIIQRYIYDDIFRNGNGRFKFTIEKNRVLLEDINLEYTPNYDFEEEKEILLKNIINKLNKIIDKLEKRKINSVIPESFQTKIDIINLAIKFLTKYDSKKKDTQSLIRYILTNIKSKYAKNTILYYCEILLGVTMNAKQKKDDDNYYNELYNSLDFPKEDFFIHYKRIRFLKRKIKDYDKYSYF